MPSQHFVLDLLSQLSSSQENRLSPDNGEPAFGPVLMGVSSGDDPIWERICEDIGAFHWQPKDAFLLAFPGQEPGPEELSVVSWVLPQTAATKHDHRKEKSHPSKRWSLVRLHGEEFNEWLRREFVAQLMRAGIQAVAPALLPQWKREMSDRHGYASTWSERHAAFAAGLGTFGLSDGLITPAGKAVRVGSAVVRAKLQPTPRPYGEDHHAYCLYYTKQKCMVCAKRCPAKAISALGHDKVACKKYIREVTAPFVESKQLGVPVSSCGLCQVGVPCESRIPGKNAE